MNPKKLAALIAVVAVLGGAVAVKRLATPRPAAEEPAPSRTLLPALSESFLDRILVKQPGAPDVELVKSAEGDWSVKSRWNVPARKSAVESLVKDFAGLRGETRSADPALLADFKIDDAQAVSVEFSGAGKEPSFLLLSPLRPASVQNFVREKGSSEVLVVKKDLLAALGLWDKASKIDYKTFADLRAIPFEPARVLRAELPSEGKGAAVSRPEPGNLGTAAWKMEPGGQAADAMSVSRFLVGLSNAYAADAADPAADWGFPAEPQVRLHEKNGEKENVVEVWLGRKDEAAKTVALKVSPGGRVYSVPEDAAAPLRKKLSDFAPAKAS